MQRWRAGVLQLENKKCHYGRQHSKFVAICKNTYVNYVEQLPRSQSTRLTGHQMPVGYGFGCGLRFRYRFKPELLHKSNYVNTTSRHLSVLLVLLVHFKFVCLSLCGVCVCVCVTYKILLHLSNSRCRLEPSTNTSKHTHTQTQSDTHSSNTNESKSSD